MVSLFNLDNDPQEATNLASKHPDVVAKLLEEADEVVQKAPMQWRGAWSMLKHLSANSRIGYPLPGPLGHTLKRSFFLEYI